MELKQKNMVSDFGISVPSPYLSFCYFLGLVSRTFQTRDDCHNAAFDLAQEIAAKSPVAVQGSKKGLNYARDHSIDESLEWIATWNQGMLQTEDIIKNAMAMQSKEKPSFNDV